MTPEEAAVINAAIGLRRRLPGRDVRERVTLEEATWKLITSCNDCNTDQHLCGCGTPVPHAGSGLCEEHESSPARAASAKPDQPHPNWERCLLPVGETPVGHGWGALAAPRDGQQLWVRRVESPFVSMMREELKDTVAPLPELGDECRCRVDVRQYCHSSQCHGGDAVPEWVLRTWQDVRADDKVRMPGTDVTAVIERRYLHPDQDRYGTAWHVVSGGNGKFAHTKDHIVQPGECVVVLAGETTPRFMNPVAPVEIELTQEQVRAAELLGWENRL